MPRLGLGVGLDLPWSGPYGITDGQVAARTQRFLHAQAHRFASIFISWQPPHRCTPALADVEGPWAGLLDALPIGTRALHHTALNLASQRPYDRRRLIEVTNDLIERFGFAWVNEDLGFWSVHGRALPYPQPPSLDRAGIAACVRNIREVAGGLAAPLVVEFPGFDSVAGTADGPLDAYDVFREIVEGTGSPCNLDTGHLLTWRSVAGHDNLLGDLDRLPLEHCVEIHCAGVAELAGQLIDTHHGVVHERQLELLDELLARCPNLRVVTFEDPRFSANGELPAVAEAQLQLLEARVQRWMAMPFAATEIVEKTGPIEVVPSTSQEDSLAERIATSSRPFGVRSREHLVGRTHRGLGSLADLYGPALALWTGDPDALYREFLDSERGRSWTEVPWAVPGRSAEDAFGLYLRGCPWLDPVVAERLHLSAVAKLLTLHPEHDFVHPETFRAVSGGWAAMGSDGTLYAAVHGRLVTGPLPPRLAALMLDEPVELAAPDRAVALAALAKMGLAPAQFRGRTTSKARS